MKNVELGFYKILSGLQGAYTLITAIWALVHIKSFMELTGPKTDIWLVKTVAVILIPIGLCFVFAREVKRDHWVVIMTGITSSIGLACIDFYFTATDTIKWIYSLDGIAQVIFLTGWIYFAFNQKKLRRTW